MWVWNKVNLLFVLSRSMCCLLTLSCLGSKQSCLSSWFGDISITCCYLVWYLSCYSININDMKWTLSKDHSSCMSNTFYTVPLFQGSSSAPLTSQCGLILPSPPYKLYMQGWCSSYMHSHWWPGSNMHTTSALWMTKESISSP